MNCAFIKESSSLVAAINRRSTMYLIKRSLMWSNLCLRVFIIRQSQINRLLCFRLAEVSCSKILQSTES